VLTFLEPRQVALQDAARQALQDADPPAIGVEPATALAARLTRSGYYRHLVPKAFGGETDQLEVRAVCALREELAYRNPGLDSVFAVQGLGSYPVTLAGTDAQKKEWLPRVATGAALFGFALSESEAGSDVASLTTEARRSGDDYLLRGAKRFISNVGVATHFTVFARTAPGPKGISAFLVPATAPGLRAAPMSLMMDHPIGELFFEDCPVPAAARLGDEGAGMRLALGTLDVFRCTVGAAAVGMGKRALDEAVAYAQTRKQFGAPLADLQGLQFLLAESATELEAARLLVHRAAAVKDAGAARITYEAAIAKLFSTEAAQRIIDRCLQVHGGNGVVKGFAVEHLYRDIRALRIYEGASEVQKVVIARHLLSR
jgi:acyl-CoA dehydrogenase